jgi:phage terminase large subunit GpA-like protein
MKQLVAEQLVTVKTKRGFQKLEWQKLRERNEALDCRVYARAAAWIAGADRWSEDKWHDLEKQVGPARPDQNESVEEADARSESSGERHSPEAVAGLIRRPPTRQGRRVFRSSYMS